MREKFCIFVPLPLIIVCHSKRRYKFAAVKRYMIYSIYLSPWLSLSNVMNWLRCCIIQSMILAKFNWQLSSPNKHYPSQRVHNARAPVDLALAPMRWIWKKVVLPKHKFFLWLLLRDSLSTRELLSRKKIPCWITELCFIFERCP
jgi:hypothetical protein